ncbi:MAG: branched-chain amino acid ABC transporter substrate-binding protein [Deltaproteobacteria bacterium]|nr:branched-chain amino acid ABC transporter substrate-binding protein [Deltaproteobacteria bacterium]
MRKIFCLSIILAMVSSSGLAADAIKIGLLGPMTGVWSNTGKEMKLVVELLAEDFNSRGGVLGRKIEIVTLDDEGTPQGAGQAAKALAKQSVTAVIGSLTSSATEASQDIFHKAKIIQISNASTAVGLTEKNLKYFFRTCPRDDEQSRVIVRTIRKMNLKKLAILYDNSASYAVGLAHEIRERARRNNIGIVFDGSLIPNQTNYLDITKRIEAVHPDALFYAGYYQEAAQLLLQKRASGWNVVFIGGDGANNPNLVSIAGKEAAEGFYFVSPPLPGELTTEYAKAFLKAFKDKHGFIPHSIDSILAGDAFRVIVNAIRQTETTDPDAIADYLHSRFFDASGLTGHINFDDKGDRLNDLYGVYRVDAEGRFVVQRMFQHGRIVK